MSLCCVQVAGDNIRTFETWYRRLDPAGTGIIQAGPAAQFLKKSALNDDLLSKVSHIGSSSDW